MIPYVISWYDGENSKSYYLTDFKNSIIMIKTAIKEIMIKKYDNYIIYIHNLTNFDAIFLLKILADLGEIKPIIHHENLISINFKFNNYKFSVLSNPLNIHVIQKMACPRN